MGEAAKRQAPMEKARVPRGPTQPYTAPSLSSSLSDSAKWLPVA